MIEKKVFYPTRHDLVKQAKEVFPPTERELTKMATIKKAERFIDNKFAVEVKNELVDLFITEELNKRYKNAD